MIRLRSALALALVALVAGAAALFAVAQARIHGTLKDENGKPVPGVKIKVTLPGSSFLVEEESNEKGVYAVTLNDATQVYTYTFEKVGYQTQSFPLKVPIGANERHDLQYFTVAEAHRRGLGGAGSDKAAQAYEQGREAFEMGDLQTARTRFQESVEIDPTLDAGFVALAKLSLLEKNYPQALEMAQRAIAIDAANIMALEIRVAVLEMSGDAAQLAQARQELAAADPQAKARFEVADQYAQGVQKYNDGDTSGAIEVFEKLVTAAPEHAHSHYMLGMCLAGSDAAKAREHLETFLRLAPDDPDATTAREMLKYLK